MPREVYRDLAVNRSMYHSPLVASSRADRGCKQRIWCQNPDDCGRWHDQIPTLKNVPRYLREDIVLEETGVMSQALNPAIDPDRTSQSHLVPQPCAPTYIAP